MRKHRCMLAIMCLWRTKNNVQGQFSPPTLLWQGLLCFFLVVSSRSADLQTSRQFICLRLLSHCSKSSITGAHLCVWRFSFDVYGGVEGISLGFNSGHWACKASSFIYLIIHLSQKRLLTKIQHFFTIEALKRREGEACLYIIKVLYSKPLKPTLY